MTIFLLISFRTCTDQGPNFYALKVYVKYNGQKQ